jgi:hypothetical protein
VLRYQIGVVAIATALAFALNFARAPYFGVAGVLSGTAAAAFLVVIPARLANMALGNPEPSVSQFRTKQVGDPVTLENYLPDGCRTSLVCE